MNEYEKNQRKINNSLIRIDKNITNILEGLEGLSDEVKSLRHEFLEFMDVAAASIAEKLANEDEHKSDSKNKSK
jgi:archaellum component FlaC